MRPPGSFLEPKSARIKAIQIQIMFGMFFRTASVSRLKLDTASSVLFFNSDGAAYSIAQLIYIFTSFYWTTDLRSGDEHERDS